MVKIKKQLVSQSVVNKRSYGYGNPVNYIVVHQTGNTNEGADAQAHANIQTNLNPRQASWHYQVDDKEAIQSFEDGVQCWHATDGDNGPGNTTGLAVEICINRDGDYKKAVKNAAELVKHLMDKHDLGINRVKQHHDFYNKNCPAQIRAGKDGITWSDFKNMITGSKTVEAPDQKVDSETITNGSIVDYLNSIGKNSSFSARKKYAVEYGIKGYKGTAKQNTTLLNKMRKGKPSKPSQAKGTVHLPASAKTWRTYKLNVKPVKKNSDWSLTPARYGGLKYEILDEPYPNVVTIKTGRGKRNIYVGSGTSAVVK